MIQLEQVDASALAESLHRFTEHGKIEPFDDQRSIKSQLATSYASMLYTSYASPASQLVMLLSCF